MKKWLIIFICCMLIFCLIGCKKTADPREREIIVLLNENKYDEARDLIIELYDGEEKKMEEMICWVNKVEKDEREIQEKIDELYLSKKLIIQSGHKLKIDGDYAYITGRVKNVSDKPISYFEIRVDYLDDDGNVLDSDYTNDGLKLNPGEQRSFEIMSKVDSFKDYSLSIGQIK